MGGHGGLNILPQKKWNVYNYDNRDIVDRDKQKHKDMLRKQVEEQRSEGLLRKIQVMKAENGVAEEKVEHSLLVVEKRKLEENKRHVNLFQLEEKIIENRELADLRQMKEQAFLQEKNMDDSCRFMSGYNKQQQPWYTKSKSNTIKTPETVDPKNYINIKDMIYVSKTHSAITRQVVEVQQRQSELRRRQRDKQRKIDYQRRLHQQQAADRDRKKQKIEEQEIYDRYDPSPRERSRDQHRGYGRKCEEQVGNLSEMELLRMKRLKREERQRKRQQVLVRDQ